MINSQVKTQNSKSKLDMEEEKDMKKIREVVVKRWWWRNKIWVQTANEFVVYERSSIKYSW